MTEDTPRQADPKSLEHRFGLVMYGGVSLAIYINGVAQEFFNAVRGRNIYRFVKALTDSDVVVDIISGTSAGGINGIMLGYALANGREFSDASGLWRNDGDIRKLLRTPGARAESGWSLLDSEGFYQPQLEAAFRDMRKIQQNVPEDPSPFSELDLFITGTDVDGNRFTQFDDAGHAIDVKDHRSVFHLKHRAGRKQHLSPDFRPTPDGPPPNREVTYKALAKLARITSCFPAAFSPVTVAGGADGRDETADAKLQYWGGLGKESCFLDGGLIDNKPFTHTLREIFFRGAVRSVDRKLFYVEPDPEHWEKLDSATQPNFFQAIVASLVGIPGYESISDDLKMLTSHNTKIDRYQRVISFLEENKSVERPTAQVRELHRRSRVIALSEWVIRGVLKIEGRFELLDKEKREKAAELVLKFDEAILPPAQTEPAAGGESEAVAPARQAASDASAATAEGLDRVAAGAPVVETGLKQGALKGAGGNGRKPDYLREHLPDFLQRLAGAADDAEKARLTEKFFKDCEDARFADGAETLADKILGCFDVDYRLRRLFRVTYYIARRLGKMQAAVLVRPEDTREGILKRSAGEGWGDECEAEALLALDYKQLWCAFNHQLELLDILRSAMVKVVEDSDFGWEKCKRGEVWRAVEAALACLLDNGTDAASTLPSALPPEKAHDCLTALLSDFNLKLRARAARIAAVTRTKVAEHGIRYDSEAKRVVPPEPFESILHATDRLEAAFVGRLEPDDPVRRAYENFEALDAKLFPVELVAELHEKDVIKTFRISPFDAQKGFSNKGLSDKVSGDALYHFGGFFKRSWRSNDILWGRLDSLCQVVETLVEPKRLGEIVNNPHLRGRVRDRFFERGADGAWRPREGLRPSDLFPHGGRAVHAELEKWLTALLVEKYEAGEDGEERKREVLALTNEMCENLIEAAQFEVLVEDLPKVIQDSLDEQVVWNQFRVGRRKFEELADGRTRWVIDAKEPDVYRGPVGDIDPFYGTVAAAGQTLTWMERMLRERPKRNGAGGEPAAADDAEARPAAAGAKPTETRLGRFFRTDYKVGTEALMKDMPLLVLLEIISVALLVLRNCVLDVFDKSRFDWVRRHPVYIAAVELPLRAFNLLIRFLRRAPRWEKGLLSGLIAGSLLTIVLAVWGRGTILFDGRKFNLLAFTGLVVLPGLLIYASYFYIRRESGKKKGKLGSIVRLLVSLVHAVLAVSPILTFGLFLYCFQASPNLPKILSRYDRYMYLLVAASALSIVGPYIVYYLTSERREGRRIEATSFKLKTLLENYFSIDEMRRVGRRLVDSVPLEWKAVEKKLTALAGGDELKSRNIGDLRRKFGSYKYVRWGSLHGRMEELEMAGEIRALADEYRIPVEDEDWPLRLESVKTILRGAGGAPADFNTHFGSKQTATWGEVGQYLRRADASGAGLKALRENIESALVPELSGDPEPRAWPFVPTEMSDSTREKLIKGISGYIPERFKGQSIVKRIVSPNVLEEWQQEHTADKIVAWAGKTGNLKKLVEHMRFVNPEALYGE